MSELKTQLNDASVDDFINSVDDETKKQDSITLLNIFKDITGEPPKMWGSSIVGFGQYHYKSERSAQEGNWMMTGFSPRKANLTLYLMDGFEEHQALLKDIGKAKTSKGCLYINKLADVDVDVLKKLIAQSYAAMKIHNA